MSSLEEPLPPNVNLPLKSPPDGSDAAPLLNLPFELHLLILPHLPWPDLLALKHSHPYFYHNVPTTVHHRVDWLLSRAPEGLPLPKEKVNLRSDAEFCASKEVRGFMRRRRGHWECKDGKEGCVVLGGICQRQRRKEEQGVWKRFWEWIGRVFGSVKGRLVGWIGTMSAVVMMVSLLGSFLIQAA